MSPDPLASITTRATPQTQPAAGIEGARQKQNTAGGYTFTVTAETRVRRFLTLGTDGGTYYASERAITQDNAKVILDAARNNGPWLVDLIVEISTAGRAPRQNPALFALAAVAGLGNDAGRRAAFDALPAVARTGTHLFLFVEYVQNFRGWGRALRRAVASWYLDKSPNDLGYQMAKYRRRGGWTHRDMLRLAKPAGVRGPHADLFEWACGRLDPRTIYDCDCHDGFRVGAHMGNCPSANLPDVVQGFAFAQRGGNPVQAVTEYGVSWEMLPDAALGEPAVWHALIERGMPQTALIRQLPRLTRLGVLKGGNALRDVTAQLQDPVRLRKGRVHPINLLMAQRTYASGQSARGESSWTPVRQIVDALDAAFYAAFQTIEPAGKRTLLALDVSGSMGWPISGLPITAREASAALALVTMATEPDTTVVGFTSMNDSRRQSTLGISELAISPRQRLDDAVCSISDLRVGSTDCSLPMVWATAQRREFDTIVVFTDNETYAGGSHPHQALRIYQDRIGVETKLIVVGMTATDFTIAVPEDPTMLDVAGFDASVPNLIADFSRGEL